VDADGAGPLAPLLHRVVDRRRETDDVTTLALAPLSGTPLSVRAGQFTMLSALGVGEAAISVSSAPGHGGPLEQTVRAVGPVTEALCRSRIGDLVGVRGPYGTDWGVEGEPALGGGRRAGDTVVVAGGIGLAPLRGAVAALVGRGPEAGRVFVLVGARQPDQIIFGDDLAAWSEAGAHVAVTVDTAGPAWPGHVGVVTTLLGQAGFDAPDAGALVCGPEVMMRFTVRALVDLGVDPGRIRLSLERNMQCGIGWCGHCQLGPLLLCRDGPVVSYSEALGHLLTVRER